MRSSYVLPPDSLTAPRNPWDMAIESLLAALLLFMPLAFGAVEEWSELAVVALAAALSLIVAIRCAVDRTFRPPVTWAYLPLALFLALIVFQLAPLPRSIVGILSPATVASRVELLGEAESPKQTLSISQYPLATMHGLRMALVAAAVFVVTATTFRTSPQVKRLLWIVFVIGCAQAVLALLQVFTHATGIYWVYPVGTQWLSSGSFVNYSNFSQFMNLSIGAGVALLLVRLQAEQRTPLANDLAWRRSSGDMLQKHGALMLATIICGLSVFMSFSRNGAISLIAAAAVVGTALFLRGTLGWRGWVLALVPLGAAALLLMFAFDAVYERMATISSTNSLEDRWQLTLATLRSWRSAPIWGIGLGAHEAVFPMFDDTTSPVIAEHADNDYAQLLEEVGVVGAVLVAAFVVIIGRMIYKLCRRGRTSLSAAAFGLAFGALAVAIHSATDFGQRLPAVFCLSAVTCGLAVQIARIERESKGRRSAPPSRSVNPGLSRGMSIAAVLVVVGASAWALRTAYSSFLGEQWWAAAIQLEKRIERTTGAVPDQDYVDLIAASQQAWEREPGNATYAYWLNARRWQAMTGGQPWTATQTQADPEAAALVARLADEMAAVRNICPTYGPPYAFEGQLRLLLLGDPRGEKLIEQGVRLAPYDAPTCLVAGQIASRAGRTDDAATLLTRAVALKPDFYVDAATCLLFDMKRPDLAKKLAGADYGALVRLADLCNDHPDLSDFAQELRTDAEALLRRQVADPAASAPELAALAAIDLQRSDAASAAALYRRALAKDYKQVQWRLALARALAAQEKFHDALHEAKICLRLHPEHSEAKQLVEELTVKPVSQ